MIRMIDVRKILLNIIENMNIVLLEKTTSLPDSAS